MRGVEAVIIDEIHALAPTKRGAHLALSLERLDALCDRPPQRIGLSATQRPLEEVARFLGGFEAPGRARPVTIVDAGIRKPLEIEVVVPVEDMGDLGQVVAGAGQRPGRRRSGPHAASGRASTPRILELVLAHRSTIIFCNARRLAERLAARLNELAEAQGARCPTAAATWSRPTTVRWRASSASSSRTSSSGASCAASSPPAASSSASTWARSTS